MADITLYHNPGCSKSRGAKEILEQHGIDFDIVEYLTQPLDRESLLALMKLLPESPADLVRRDSCFDALGLEAADCRSAEQVADLLVAHPELMQRPIAVRGERAVIARPPERIETLFNDGK